MWTYSCNIGRLQRPWLSHHEIGDSGQLSWKPKPTLICFSSRDLSNLSWLLARGHREEENLRPLASGVWCLGEPNTREYFVRRTFESLVWFRVGALQHRPTLVFLAVSYWQKRSGRRDLPLRWFQQLFLFSFFLSPSFAFARGPSIWGVLRPLASGELGFWFLCLTNSENMTWGI